MKRILIIIALLLLIGSSYFTYDKWVKHADVSLWSFIPQQSIAIYESDDPLHALSQISDTEIWENLGYLEGVKKLTQNLKTLDSIAAPTGFQTFFKESPSLMAIDLTSSKSFDFLFVIEIQNLSQQTFISKAQAYFKEKGFIKKTRSYLGFTITELNNPKTEKAFTYIFFKNFFIGSFSAFLVEDAIRTVSDEETASFMETNTELMQVAKLEKDEGNIYLNMKRMPSLIGAFSSENLNDLNIAKSAFLDLKIKNQSINLSGFTFLDERENYLNNFKSLPGGDFDIAEVIPTETTWLVHMSANNPSRLGENLKLYLQTEDPAAFRERNNLLQTLDFDVNYIYRLIDEEIAIATLESIRAGEQNKLLLLEIKDMGEALRYINASTERYAAKTDDSVYVEPFGEYEIRKLPVGDFPKAMLGSIASGFGPSYYLTYRNYLIFSNSLQQLKNFTISIDNESTWTKSIRTNKFLDQTNKAANLSLFFNAPRGWSQLTNNLKPDWKDYFNEAQFTIKNLEFQAYQWSAVDDKFYTNWIIYQPELPKRNIPERISVQHSLTLVDDIATKPYLVSNHNDQSKEIVLQDASNELYLVGSEFDVLWSKSLQEQIITPLMQIDYYKNGKLQYLFATGSAIHIIDRTGSYLPEFPKSISSEYPIAALSLIDYKNTKDYRYAITTKKGEVFLTDKNVKPLNGWSPKAFDSKLVESVRHVRIGGKDAMVVLQQNGKLSALTRRGELMAGFPIDLETDVTDAYFISKGNSFDNTLISLVTIGGELINVNLNGVIKRRDQLYKSSTETTFELIEDVTGDTYVILRKTNRQYEVLDDQGELLFQKDYFSKESLFRQYYNLGGGVEFFIFVDPAGTFLYLYDRAGNLLTGTPLAASQPISLMKNENEYQIYRAVDRNLELISISY